MNAQYASIAGQCILNKDNQDLKSNIILKNAIDSTIVKLSVADEQGFFLINQISKGIYSLEIQTLGHETKTIESIQIIKSDEKLDLGKIELASIRVLNTATIRAFKPMIERKNDRLLVNVENSSLSGASSALEVLGKSPNIFLNQNEEVILKGKAGVRIMIDGKPLPLSASELSNYLKSLPASTIERIEIISNPSAKYDASGSAGIIDIIMKKSKEKNTTGTINLFYGQGVYPKTGGGFSLNHKSEKIQLYGGYNYNFRKGMNDLNIYKEFLKDGNRLSAFNQKNYLLMDNHIHSGRIGLDLQYSPKTKIGLMLHSMVHQFNPTGTSTTEIEDAFLSKVSTFVTKNNSHDIWPNYALNANVKHLVDTLGRSLTLDIDYAKYWNTTNQFFNTQYSDLNGNKYQPDYNLDGDLQGNLQIRSIKMDYTHPFHHQKWKAEIGVKASSMKADNELEYYDVSNTQQPLYDTFLSNHFIYQENIQAAYITMSGKIDKLELQFGLRMENSDIDGIQLVDQVGFEKNYTNFFPSIFMNYPIAKNYNLGLNLSRRIDRPSYDQLNPFKLYLDPTLFKAGNPNLNPQYSWAIETNHTFYDKYFFSLGYELSYQPITEVVGPIPNKDRVSIQTNVNLDLTTYFTFNSNIPLNPTKWWTSQNNTSLFYGWYRGTYATTNLNDGNLVCFLSSNNNFKLPKKYSFEANFSLTSPQQYAFMYLYAMWGLDLGIQKKIMNNRGTVKLAATDIFWTNRPRADNEFNEYREYFNIYRDNRTISLSFNYRFGNNKLSPADIRKGGAEEEKKRANKNA